MLKTININENELIISFETEKMVFSNLGQLKATLMSTIEKSNKNIIIDMENVDVINSAALGFFVSLKKTLESKNLHLKIINTNQNIKELFSILNLDKHINIS